MNRTISLINQKGGSGKTTTVVNLGASLAYLGRKVLLVDLDPRAHTTIHLGFKPSQVDITIYDVIMNLKNLKTAIINTGINRLDILPSNIELSVAEIELVNMAGREAVLKNSLPGIKDDYDFILIDCPPSLGLLTLNALNASGEVFIPIQTEFFALEGMSKLLKTIDIVRERLNKELKITGIILTMFDSRKNICRDVAEKVEEFFPGLVFKTRIRDNVKLAEAPSYGKPVITYAVNSYGSKDYLSLAKEVIACG